MVAVIAHRGLHGQVRENTVEAFALAVGLGVAGIELDARRTADRQLVVHHDAVLPDGRMIVATDRDGLPDWMPDLATALDACRGAFVNVEIKNDPREPDGDATDQVAHAVAELLGGRPEPASNWIVSSFNRQTVDAFRQLSPEVPTAWLTNRPVTDAQIESLSDAGHTALHPWVPTIDAELVARCHAHRLRVNAWTCNDATEACQLAAWGIDGICTDTPADLLTALADWT